MPILEESESELSITQSIEKELIIAPTMFGMPALRVLRQRRSGTAARNPSEPQWTATVESSPIPSCYP